MYRITALTLLTLLFCTMIQAQEEVTVKSVKSIYNREDQSRLTMALGSKKFQLFLDQSSLKLNTTLTAENISQMASEGKIPAFQPNKLRREVTENEIRVFSKQKLPEEFSMGDVTYHKIEIDLGEEDGKRVITEAYASGNTSDEIAAAIASLNFQWEKLKINKTCKKPICEQVRVKDGKPICVKVRCEN